MVNPPYISSRLPGIGGRIRVKNSDFIVTEIPLYEPSGQGSHLYVNITKDGMETNEVAGLLADRFGMRKRDIGLAGMKDKHAVTTQTLSVPVGDRPDMDAIKESMKGLPFKVNWLKFHNNKLRRGHLLGNAFRIRITGISMPLEKALERTLAIAESLKETGLPNYFGEQRFGIQGNNAGKGLSIIRNEMRVRDRWLRRFLISSYQSHLCNLYLAKRVRSGLFNKLIDGDVAKKHDTGGIFIVEDAGAEQPRFENKEISFTSPIYGPRMTEAEGESFELERSVLDDEGVTLDEIGRSGATGTRRLGRLLVPDLDVKSSGDGIILEFSLPKGAFATTCLREIMKPDDGAPSIE